MKKTLALVLCILLIMVQMLPVSAADEASVTSATASSTKIPAFPGAEGYGAYASGGRGGEVYEVTNLNDSGPGSLRDAVSQPNRTVVFRVSGTITLKSELKIQGNITIAGQTAPGDGITVKGYPTSIRGDNVIIRYMRFRLGDENNLKSDSFDINGRKNIILDHCSFSWGVDENISMYDNTNLTVQWCIISEGLNYMNHSCGGLWGPRSSYHHNLFAHNKTRNPKLAYLDNNVSLDFRNNVIYDWGEMSVYTGSQGLLNIVNNYYKPGPSTTSHATTLVSPDSSGTNKIYISGNYLEGSPEITEDNWKGVTDNAVRAYVPYTAPYVTTHSAEEAYHLVLAEAGASLVRDAIDARIVNEVLTGTGSIIDHPAQVGGYPELKSTTPPDDSDHDGMPDYWEIANGLNPNDPEDRNGDFNNDGYTNLEDYLNSLAHNGQHKPIIYYNGPAANSIIEAPADITLAADVIDVEGNITKVEFYDGNTLLYEDTSAPYSYTLKGLSDGTYNFAIKAYSDSGLVSMTDYKPVYVNTNTSVLPWTSEDIGSVGMPGSSNLINGVLTAKGAGEIGGTEDSFNFLYQKLEGDGEIIAKIEADTSLAGAKAGIMMRNSLSPDSAAVMIGISYAENSKTSKLERQITFSERTEDGAVMSSVSAPLPVFPVWVKLSKADGAIKGYISFDGSSWVELFSSSASMNKDCYIGVASGAVEKTSGKANYNVIKLSNVSTVGVISPALFLNKYNASVNNPDLVLSGNTNKECVVTTIVNGKEAARQTVGNDLAYKANIKLAEDLNEITIRASVTQVIVDGEVLAEIPTDPDVRLASKNYRLDAGINQIELVSDSTGKKYYVRINVKPDAVAKGSSIELNTLVSEQTINIALDTIAPVINTDYADITVNAANYKLTGTTSENSIVTVVVNDKPVEVETDENNQYQVKLALSLGANKVTVQAVDFAGNKSDVKSMVITLVDNTAPNVTYPESIMQSEPYAVEITDDLSGVDKVKIEINGKTYNTTEIDDLILPIGTHDVSITVSDKAGNIGEISYKLTVKIAVDDFSNVLSKANLLGLINSANYDKIIAPLNNVLANRYNAEKAAAYLDTMKSEVEAASSGINAEFKDILLSNIAYLKNLYLSGNANEAAGATSFKFDFGSGNVVEGYTQVLTTTIYTPQLGYGFIKGLTYNERVRKGPDDLLRDFVFANEYSYQFMVDLPNGEYTVTLISGDRDAIQEPFKVTAEGELKLENVGAAKGEFTTQTFNVTVKDNQLNLLFQGQNIVRLNALEITPVK